MTKIIPNLHFAQLPDEFKRQIGKLRPREDVSKSGEDSEVATREGLGSKRKFSDTDSCCSINDSFAKSREKASKGKGKITLIDYSANDQYNLSSGGWRGNDFLSGKPTMELRDANLNSNRPYVFGRAFLFSEGKKEEIFLDGARLVEKFDSEIDEGQHIHGIDASHPMNLTMGEDVFGVSEPMMFITYKRGMTPYPLGGLYELMKSHLDSMFISLAVQGHNGYDGGSEEDTTVSIAALFKSGKIVRQDDEYAEELLKAVHPHSVRVEAANGLEVAVCVGDLELAKVLLDMGANPRIPSNPPDLSALGFARRNGNQRMIQLLEGFVKLENQT